MSCFDLIYTNNLIDGKFMNKIYISHQLVMLAATIFILTLSALDCCSENVVLECQKPCDEQKGPIWTSADGESCKVFATECDYIRSLCNPASERK